MKEILALIGVIVLIACFVVHVPTKEELAQEKAIKEQMILDQQDEAISAARWHAAKELSKLQR